MALRALRKFLCRHRIKLAVAGAVGGGLAARLVYRRVMAEAERFADDLQRQLTDEYQQQLANDRRREMLFRSRQRQRSRLLRAALVSLSPKISTWIPAGKALAQVKAASEANRRAKVALRQDPASERLRAEAETAQASFREQFQHAASLAVAKVVALCLTTAAADVIVRVAVGAAMRSASVSGEEGRSAGTGGLSAAEREALISQVLDQWLEDGAERLCSHVVRVVQRDGIRHGLDATVSVCEVEDLVRTLCSSIRLSSSSSDALTDTLMPANEPALRTRVVRAAAEASAREEEEKGETRAVAESALTAALDETLDILESPFVTDAADALVAEALTAAGQAITTAAGAKANRPFPLFIPLLQAVAKAAVPAAHEGESPAKAPPSVSGWLDRTAESLRSDASGSLAPPVTPPSAGRGEESGPQRLGTLDELVFWGGTCAEASELSLQGAQADGGAEDAALLERAMQQLLGVDDSTRGPV